MGELIKTSYEPNYTALSKNQERINLRNHLLMMLEAMQYDGSTTNMTIDTLRSLVEEQKIVFLRKLQALQQPKIYERH